MKKRKRWAGIILPILIKFLVSSYPTSWMSHFKWPSLPSWYSTRTYRGRKEACDDNGGMMGRLSCFLGVKIGCHCCPRRHHCHRQHLPRWRRSLRRGRYFFSSWISLNASRMVSSKKAHLSWVRNEGSENDSNPVITIGRVSFPLCRAMGKPMKRWNNNWFYVDHFLEQLLPWDVWLAGLVCALLFSLARNRRTPGLLSTRK